MGRRKEVGGAGAREGAAASCPPRVSPALLIALCGSLGGGGGRLLTTRGVSRVQMVDRHWTPHKIDFPMPSIRIVSVSAGPFHCAAVSSHGGLYTWGDGFGGRLGHGTHQSRFVPAFVDYFNGPCCAVVLSSPVSRDGKERAGVAVVHATEMLLLMGMTMVVVVVIVMMMVTMMTTMMMITTTMAMMMMMTMVPL